MSRFTARPAQIKPGINISIVDLKGKSTLGVNNSISRINFCSGVGSPSCARILNIIMVGAGEIRDGDLPKLRHHKKRGTPVVHTAYQRPPATLVRLSNMGKSTSRRACCQALPPSVLARRSLRQLQTNSDIPVTCY